MKSAGVGIATTIIIILSVIIMINITMATVIKNECVTALNTAAYQTACYMYQSQKDPSDEEIKTEILKYFKIQLPKGREGEIEDVRYISEKDGGMISVIGTVSYQNISGNKCSVSAKRTLVLDDE